MVTAKHLRVFQNPRAIIQQTSRKLSALVTEKGNIFPPLAAMGATVLCIATLGEGPIITTVFTGQKWKFGKYCMSAKTGAGWDAQSEPDELVSHL